MSSTELLKIAKTLDSHTKCESGDIDNLFVAANEVGESFSGSWLGYHSRIYYKDFKAPPPGARFSREWGIEEAFSGGTRGEWIENQFNDVVSFIQKKAGNPAIKDFLELSKKSKEAFEEARTNTLSISYARHYLEGNKFLASLVKEIEQEKILCKEDFIVDLGPKGEIGSRDMIAFEKGLVIPPHISIIAQVSAAKHPFQACKNLQKLIIKVSNHIEIMARSDSDSEKLGTTIFIGHGRSQDWRALKDFLNNRLNLLGDEFDRVSNAGITNIDRLSQMLDQACFAFLVMTAEEEKLDGSFQARMNVIHEVGLFQGHLGFDKAIVLLEEGCAEFTNIQGLGQIRFPKGDISAIFERVRNVLEREGIIK